MVTLNFLTETVLLSELYDGFVQILLVFLLGLSSQYVLCFRIRYPFLTNLFFPSSEVNLMPFFQMPVGVKQETNE